MKSEKKIAIPKFSKRCLGFLGMQLIATQIATLSMQYTWTRQFGPVYFIINIISYVSVMISALMTPFLQSKMSTRKIFNINIAVQILSCAVFAIIPFISGQYYGRVLYPARYYIALITTILFAALSGVTFGAAQVSVLAMASKLSPKAVKAHLTGYSVGFLVVFLYLMAPMAISRKINVSHPISYILPILLHFGAIWVFAKMDTIASQSQSRGNDMDAEAAQVDQNSSLKEDFIAVAGEKKLLMGLNFVLFFHTFALLPFVLNTMTPSNTKMVHCWGYILTLFFIVFEITSRLLTTFASRVFDQFIHKKSLPAIFFLRTLLCVFPFFAFLAARKVFVMDPSVTDAFNVVSYSLIGFSLGMIGNCIAAFFFEGMESDRKRRASSALFVASMALGVVLGMCLGAILVKAIPGPSAAMGRGRPRR